MRHSLGVTAIRTLARVHLSAAPAIALPWLGVAVGIGAQIAYPLSSGSTLDTITLLSVMAFFLAVTGAVAGASSMRTAGRCALFILAAGWAIEAIGVHTGFPFGRYEYTSALGGSLASVPLVVPLAWAGMAPIALLVGRALGGTTRIGCALAGAGFLTSWDLFLDPQMVADGRWRWLRHGATVPGIHGIPVTNFAGWLVVSFLLVAALDRMLPALELPVADAVLYWTYFSQLLAAAVFFDRPSVALAGGIAMGCFVIPYRRNACRLRAIR